MMQIDGIVARHSCYQRVSSVLVYAEFPLNAAGTVPKREMRAPFWNGRETKI